ncbi:hypothetical protein OY671_011773 [Metschnikowia pulcherrima]|nr:hypothetical protein OY671_011773 [Metschnikowia pulcherrima]
MGGVAHENHVSLDPFGDRLAIAEHPHPPCVDLGEQPSDGFAIFRKPGSQLAGVTSSIPTFHVSVGVKNGDQVEEVPTAKRVLDQMVPGAGPKYHLIPAILRLDGRNRQDGPIGDVAGHHRHPICDNRSSCS